MSWCGHTPVCGQSVCCKCRSHQLDSPTWHETQLSWQQCQLKRCRGYWCWYWSGRQTQETALYLKGWWCVLAWKHLQTVLFLVQPTPSTAPFIVMVSKEEMPAGLDAIILQQTNDAKEHVRLLEMLWYTNIEHLNPLSGVVTLVCRSSIMSSTNMVAAYLSWFKLSDGQFWLGSPL